MFGWIGFYSISSILGYLMSNPINTFIWNIYDLETHFVDNILNESELIFFFFCIQMNSFKYIQALIFFHYFEIHPKHYSRGFIIIIISRW